MFQTWWLWPYGILNLCLVHLPSFWLTGWYSLNKLCIQSTISGLVIFGHSLWKWCSTTPLSTWKSTNQRKVCALDTGLTHTLFITFICFTGDIFQLCTKFDVYTLFNSEASDSMVNMMHKVHPCEATEYHVVLADWIVMDLFQCSSSGLLQSYTHAGRFCFLPITAVICNTACNFAKTRVIRLHRVNVVLNMLVSGQKLRSWLKMTNFGWIWYQQQRTFAFYNVSWTTLTNKLHASWFQLRHIFWIHFITMSVSFFNSVLVSIQLLWNIKQPGSLASNKELLHSSDC